MKEVLVIISLLLISVRVNSQNTARGFFDQAFDKNELKDYQGAIGDYTKAIEIFADFDLAYLNRGLVKIRIEDYYGAIADYNKAIEIGYVPISRVYAARGQAKVKLKDYYGAIADFNKVIELDAKLVSKIKAYQSKEGLQNERGLDRYIDKILTEKAEKEWKKLENYC